MLMVAGCVLVAANSTMRPMAAMTKHVKERASKKEEEGQDAKEVSAVFRDEEESGDHNEACERPPCARRPIGVGHGVPLSRSG